jgi:hypothetical protein
MEELPFVPMLIGIQWWQNLLNLISDEDLRSGPPQQRSAQGGVLSQQIEFCCNQADWAVAASREVADQMRHGFFETMSAAVQPSRDRALKT